MKTPYLYLYLIFLTNLAQAQYNELGNGNNTFPRAFAELPKEGTTISTQNPIKFNFEEGHIQGIQFYGKAGQNYLYMTGNSFKAAYVIKTELKGEEAKVIALDTLMLYPYRHAGGFQIFENYLVVGIEDEDRKNTSQVRIYDLDKGEKLWSEPLHTIKRDGEYKRSTAGTAGLTKIGDHILMVIGDWDSRNLDFYICPVKKFKKGAAGFKLVQSLSMDGVSKANWSDSTWLPYQNINLFADKNELYLAGLTSENGKHIADLFQLEVAEEALKATSFVKNSVQLKKLQSRDFNINGNASFRDGAGITRLANGDLMLLASPGQVGGSSTLSIFNYIK